MANEVAAANTYIFGKLSGLLSGRVYFEVAPTTATFPLIVFGVQSYGNDVIVVGGHRVWANPLYRVEVIGQTASLSGIAGTADAIDAALHNTSGGAVAWCVRESIYSRAEIPEGVNYMHLGGFYRLRVTGG